MARGDDFDEDDDPGIVPLHGAAPDGSGGTAEVSDLLMDVLCASTKLKWLIKELDDAEHRVVAERLAALKVLVASIPDAGRAGKRVGFKAPAKRGRR